MSEKTKIYICLWLSNHYPLWSVWYHLVYCVVLVKSRAKTLVCLLPWINYLIDCYYRLIVIVYIYNLYGVRYSLNNSERLNLFFAKYGKLTTIGSSMIEIFFFWRKMKKKMYVKFNFNDQIRIIWHCMNWQTYNLEAYLLIITKKIVCLNIRPKKMVIIATGDIMTMNSFTFIECNSILINRKCQLLAPNISCSYLHTRQSHNLSSIKWIC